LAELARQEEERRREAELAAERRAENTVKFKACNQSSKGKIYFVMMYYDYDASDWIVEGWWHIPQGGCIYVGDQVRRGTVYFYAHANRERYVWSGSFGLCVSWDRFRRVNKPRSCSSKNFRRFIEKYIDQSEYEQNFVD
jgi:uncharacterized membrane protein